MNTTKVVRVPALGDVSGIYDTATGISQFLGVPYGTLSRRWSRARPVTSFPEGSHDGTIYGASCPQVYQAGDPSIQQLAVPGFPSNPELTMDEFSCLNMNIVVPDNHSGNMPVMVWIHGGGFAIGSNTETVYNGLQLVETSAKAGTPIVYVAINYRVGAFGFLSSEKLSEENGGKAVGNYGLWDQRLALEFVKSNISAFGGNENLITIFGESAGGASVQAHLLANKKLFNQAICQSGVVRTIGPFPAESPYMSGRYGMLAECLGYENSVEPEILRTVPPERLVQAMSKLAKGTLAAYFITDDSTCEDGFFPTSTDWISNQSFCERFMIGDCQTEGVIMAPCMRQMKSADIVKLLCDPSTLDRKYMAKFGLEPQTVEGLNHHDPDVMQGLIDLQTELAFFGPSEAIIAVSPSATTYVYRFNRVNSWTAGPFRGLAHHTIDLAYLAGVPKLFPTVDPDKDIHLSDTMMKQWIDFGVGKEPWKPTGEEGWQMVYAEDGDIKLLKRHDVRTRDFENVRAIVGRHASQASRISASLSLGMLL